MTTHKRARHSLELPSSPPPVPSSPTLLSWTDAATVSRATSGGELKYDGNSGDDNHHERYRSSTPTRSSSSLSSLVTTANQLPLFDPIAQHRYFCPFAQPMSEELRSPSNAAATASSTTTSSNSNPTVTNDETSERGWQYTSRIAIQMMVEDAIASERPLSNRSSRPSSSTTAITTTPSLSSLVQAAAPTATHEGGDDESMKERRQSREVTIANIHLCWVALTPLFLHYS
jgi:hypothetical protein